MSHAPANSKVGGKMYLEPIRDLGIQGLYPVQAILQDPDCRGRMYRALSQGKSLNISWGSGKHERRRYLGKRQSTSYVNRRRIIAGNGLPRETNHNTRVFRPGQLHVQEANDRQVVDYE